MVPKPAALLLSSSDAEERFHLVRFSGGLASIVAGPLAVTAGSVALVIPWLVLGAAAVGSPILGILAALAMLVVGAAILRARADDRFEQRLAIRLAAVGLVVCSSVIFAGLGRPAWPFGVVALIAAIAAVAMPLPMDAGAEEGHPLRTLFGDDAVGEQQAVQFCVLLPTSITEHAEAMVVFCNACDAERTIEFKLRESAATVLDPTQHLAFPAPVRVHIGPLAIGLVRIPVRVDVVPESKRCAVAFQLEVEGSSGNRRVPWRARAYRDVSSLERVARSGGGPALGYPVWVKAAGAVDDELQARCERFDAAELAPRVRDALGWPEDAPLGGP